MTPKDPTRNDGPWYRRLGQALGLIYNDDGTWSGAHLESAKGKQRVAEDRRIREAKAQRKRS